MFLLFVLFNYIHYLYYFVFLSCLPTKPNFFQPEKEKAKEAAKSEKTPAETVDCYSNSSPDLFFILFIS
jgi:hypothetical protein